MVTNPCPASSHDLTEPPGGTMQENLSKSTPKPPPIVNPPRFLRPDVPAGPPKPKNKTMWTNRTVHVEMGGGSKEKEHRYGLGSEVRADLGRQTVRAMISDVDEDKGMYEVLYGDEGEKVPSRSPPSNLSGQNHTQRTLIRA
eukprot:569141-Amorphochlora_amoeboformis.AAC.2